MLYLFVISAIGHMVYIDLNVQPRVILITSSNNYEYYSLPWLLGSLVEDPILFLLIRKVLYGKPTAH